MALGRFQAQALDAAGNAISLPVVEVRRESDNGLEVLYSDTAGLVPISSSGNNPFTGAADGYFSLCAPDGFYKITVTKGPYSRTWRDVGINRAGEGYSRLTEFAAAPTTPAAGFKLLYAKDDGKLYTRNSAGVEVEVGAGAAIAFALARVVATSNVNLANGLENGDALDGVTLATGDFVLLTAQTAPAENGLYPVVASGAATRAPLFSTYDSLCGVYFSIQEGTAGADKLYRCTSNRGGTLGTTAIAISEFAAGGGRPLLSGNLTYYVGYNLGLGTVTIASPGVWTLNAHGLSNNSPVLLSILPFERTITAVTVASPGVVTTSAAHGMAVGQPFRFITGGNGSLTNGTFPTGITPNTTTYYVKTVPTSTTFTFAATAAGAAINTSGSALAGTNYMRRTGTLPTGLAEKTVYFARNVTTNTFELSLTSGGASINTSSTQEGVFNVMTGDDTHNGQTDSVAGALLTLTKADELARLLDFNSKVVTVKAADGKHPDAMTIGAKTGQAGEAYFTIAPTSGVASECITAGFSVGAPVHFQDVGFEGSGYAISVHVPGVKATYSGVRFGPRTAGGNIQTAPGASAQAVGAYSIIGGAVSHWVTNGESAIIDAGQTITITGNPTFTQFAFQQGGTATVWFNTYNGNCTGQRYLMNPNCNSTLLKSGATLPGNSTGSPASGISGDGFIG